MIQLVKNLDKVDRHFPIINILSKRTFGPYRVYNYINNAKLLVHPVQFHVLSEVYHNG